MRSCVLLTLFSCLLDLRRVEASGRPGRPDGGDGETERREFYDDVVITACFLSRVWSLRSGDGEDAVLMNRAAPVVRKSRPVPCYVLTHARGCEHRVLEE